MTAVIFLLYLTMLLVLVYTSLNICTSAFNCNFFLLTLRVLLLQLVGSFTVDLISNQTMNGP